MNFMPREADKAQPDSVPYAEATGWPSPDSTPAQTAAAAERHLALIREISEMATQERPSGQVFVRALKMIEESYRLALIAFYADQPLALRVQRGGLPVQPGTPVPDGLAQLASRTQSPQITDDVRVDARFELPPLAPNDVRSQAALPITFRNRRIGVLDLYSVEPMAFANTDVLALMIVAQQLAVMIGHEHSAEGGDTRQRLESAYQRLQEFSELKDQMLQNISHELRTPLTLIKGYLELMLMDEMGSLLAEQRATLGTVLRRVDDVVRIVDQIVSLSPITSLSLDFRPIPVGPLLSEMVEVFQQRTAGSKVALALEPVPEGLYLYGEPEKIRQVCYNILDNSVKFSPDGGRITVRAAAEDVYVHLVFQDEGIGIPKARLSSIFDTFYQVDGSTTRRFGGLGLGLAVVNRVVAAHNGKVWAESELSRGSAFHVLLPRQAPHVPTLPSARLGGV